MLSWIRRPVVISGPSGCGKSSLLKRLFAKYPNQFGFSVSHTTRKPRAGEVDGREYHFVDVDTFQGMIERGEFLEYAIYSNNYYGTTFKGLNQVMENDKVAILDIDLAGVQSVHAQNDRVHARFLFIKTKDLETLESRLRGRSTETEESLQLRLSTAKSELEYAEKYPETHDATITNESLDSAFEQLEHFLFHEPRSISQ